MAEGCVMGTKETMKNDAQNAKREPRRKKLAKKLKMQQTQQVRRDGGRGASGAR